MKKLTALILVAIMLLSLVACLEPKEKTFKKDGLEITLTSSFKETKIENYTVCYDSKKVAVYVLKESFSLLAGFEDKTLAEYGEMLRTANASRNPGVLKTEEGLTYFEYTFRNENVDFKYFTVVYKGSDAFWMVQFASREADYDDVKEDMIKWAKSVKV